MGTPSSSTAPGSAGTPGCAAAASSAAAASAPVRHGEAGATASRSATAGSLHWHGRSVSSGDKHEWVWIWACMQSGPAQSAERGLCSRWGKGHYAPTQQRCPTTTPCVGSPVVHASVLESNELQLGCGGQGSGVAGCKAVVGQILPVWEAMRSVNGCRVG